MRARGFHGVLPDEKRDGQDFVVDVVLHLDLRPAGTSDDLTATVNYAEVGADVVAIGWMIEELRISLFAQSIGTAQSVSAKRVRAAIAAVPT